MPRTRKFKRIPSNLDWAKFYDAVSRASPQRAEEMAKVATAAKVRAEYFARDSRRARQRDELEDFESRLKVKAEFDAAQTELRYTAKQKVEIERWRRAPQLARQSGIFDKDELDQIDRQSMMGIMGITPTEMFKATPWPKGEGIGDVFDKNGAKVSRKIDGETWQIDHRKTEIGQAAEHELKATQAQAKLQGDIDKERRSFERDLYLKEVLSADGLTKRSRTSGEIQQILRSYGRSKELEEARDFVSEINAQYPGSVGEIPMELRQQFFNAMDLIKETRLTEDMPTVNTDADYDKLPPGTEFIDSEGKRFRKPEKGR